MNPRRRFLSALLVSLVALVLANILPAPALAQAYAGHPKLIVIVVIDQFRGDYLNRDHSEFKGRGFKLFMDEGAWFTDCYFDYANTKTAPGHATIGRAHTAMATALRPTISGMLPAPTTTR